MTGILYDYLMKKLLAIVILGLLWSELVYAGQKIIYIGGSTWTLESSETGQKYTYHFYEGGKCQVTWVDWWTYTDNN